MYIHACTCTCTCVYEVFSITHHIMYYTHKILIKVDLHVSTCTSQLEVFVHVLVLVLVLALFCSTCQILANVNPMPELYTQCTYMCITHTHIVTHTHTHIHTHAHRVTYTHTHTYNTKMGVTAKDGRVVSDSPDFIDVSKGLKLASKLA